MSSPKPIWRDRRLVSIVLFGLVLLVAVLTQDDYQRLDLPIYGHLYDLLGPVIFKRVMVIGTWVMVALCAFAALLRFQELKRTRGSIWEESGDPRHPSFKRMSRSSQRDE